MKIDRRYPANLVSAGLRILVAIVALGVCVGAVIAGGWLALLTFTWQSNFMVAASFLWTAWALVVDRRTPPEWLAGSSVFYIAITGLVYNFVIAPGSFRVGDYLVAGLTGSDIAHVIVPIAATVIWLMFEEHRRIPFAYIWIWQVYLVAYLTLIIAVIHLADGVSAPYPFLDVPALGWGPVLTELLTLVLAFTALAALLVTADRTLPPRTAISEHDRFDEYYRKGAATVTRP
ncbi:MAG: Pr6Pr family membrane protein [Demequina sp.]